MISIPGFTIKERIYQSSKSLVFRGIRQIDQLPVVLKILKSDYPTPEEVARFKREYEILRRLKIEGVITVHGLERFNNSWMIIEEDFGGESMTNLLSSQPLNVLQLLRLFVQITEIIEKIHQQKIIHKDINPSNIVWNPKGNANHETNLKVIDFGISTELSQEHPKVLSPNVLEGTLSFISPEQTGRMNRSIDYRTDLYSLGATLYWLMTHRKPFESEDAMELVHSHIAKPPKPPNELDSTIPQMISDIILKLMEKMPENRYQSALGLKADLQQCLDAWISNKFIEPFEIGKHDRSDQFQVPQKLLIIPYCVPARET